MRKLSFVLLAMALIAFVGSSVLQSDATAGDATVGEEHAYIGASKCKTCHKKPEVGEQFPLWEKSKHAQAYNTLATDKAKEIAKAKDSRVVARIPFDRAVNSALMAGKTDVQYGESAAADAIKAAWEVVKAELGGAK